MIEVVAFDLWDTLIYMEDNWKTFTQLKQFIPEVARDASFWREKVKPIYLFREQESPETFLQSLYEELGIDLRGMAQRMCNQLEYDLENTKVYPETFSILERAQRAGKKLAVISNQCSFYKPSFESLGLSKYFDFILFSCDLGYGKPDSRAYHKLSGVSHTQPRNILIIGDHKHNDYEKPLKIGFQALHLSRSGKIASGQVRSLDEISF